MEDSHKRPAPSTYPACEVQPDGTVLDVDPDDINPAGSLGTIEGLQEVAYRAGFWIRYSSRFFPPGNGPSLHHVGLCPLGTSGWNGRMDQSFDDYDISAAVEKAAAWLAISVPEPTS